MTDTNLPEFAQTMAAIPKRLRAGLNAHQHGRDNTMLVPSEHDADLFVGRLTKTGKRRYRFEAFGKAVAMGEVAEAQVIASGRASSPLRGIGEARRAHGFFNAK